MADVDYKPPLEIGDQFSLLWVYRRALAQVMILERELEAKAEEIVRLQAGREELSAMVQELIIATTDREYKKTTL